MGVRVEIQPQLEQSGGEPTAHLMVRHQIPHRTVVGGELLTRMIDEVPVLCAIAAGAKGSVEIRDAQELRVKESDRLATMTKVLRAFDIPWLGI